MHAKPFIPAHLEVRTEHGSDFLNFLASFANLTCKTVVSKSENSSA
jgi:hypothetical protein